MNNSTKMLVIFAIVLVVTSSAGANGVTVLENDPGLLRDQTSVYQPIVISRSYRTSSPTVFGVQMYGNTARSSPYHRFLIDSGASWLRVAFSWYLIEPENVDPSAYNWASADLFTSAARADSGGLTMIVTIGGNPEWASDYRNGPLDPEDLSSYVEFVEAVVERYDGDGIDDAPGSPIVNHWEIYNEPDRGSLGYDFRWGNYAGEYAQLLAAVYPAVKNANPQAQVLLGGMAYDWFEDQGGYFVRTFLDDLLSAGGGDYFDIINFHVYPVFWMNWTNQESPGLLEKASFIKDKMAGYGYPDKPIIASEAGWHSNDHSQFPSTPEIQARYVAELFTQSLAAELKTMIWWMLHDPVGNHAYENGLLTNDSPPQAKLAFYAYQNAVSQLGSASFHRILPVNETGASEMEAYEFRDNLHRQTVYVAWLNPISATGVKPLRIAASLANVIDIYGASYAVSDGQDGQADGYVTINVGGQPGYIVVDW